MPAAPYTPNLEDMRFTLSHIGAFSEIISLPPYTDISAELAAAVLEEAAKFASAELSPINHSCDREGTKRDSAGNVTMPAGFKGAYQRFVDNGWNAAPIAASLGGQGLPLNVSTLVAEMWHGANMSFGLCPMLTQSAIELISHHASESLKTAYLPKLVSGEWAGTMCMTEPEAGSDVGAVRTRAVPEKDYYRIKGTKIFITYGEHDLTDNIIHMVLARLPDAPTGTKGLSLFLVPKFLPDGARNDVLCVSTEHKMGINASPTCVMEFGEKEGSVGWLVGEPHGGIKAMFTMMNSARFAVGLEGIGIMGYAHQLAAAYAESRIQGGKPIAQHGDVKRMLLTMRAHSEAMRALAVYTARHMDIARHHVDSTIRATSQGRVDILIPILKAHGTQLGFDMASLSMQVHGGIGYIEETGVCQLMRDVRVAMIYEGTNGIQSLDLAGRKLLMQDGNAMDAWHTETTEHVLSLKQNPHTIIKGFAKYLEAALDNLSTSTKRMRTLHSEGKTDEVQMRAQDYLTLSGNMAEAYMLTLAAVKAEEELRAASLDYDRNFLERKIETAAFFCERLL